MIVAAALIAAVAAWFSLRYAWWRPAVDYRFPRILMYHMIAEPRRRARFNGLRVSPRNFEWQLRWLKQRGWTSVTLGELLEMAPPLPPRLFVITFDDGYADNLLQALPLLKKYRCKATLYLVVERFDRDWSVQRKPHHDDGELRREAKLSDDQVQQLLDSGCVELGSHSMTHANFARLGAEAVFSELEASRQALERRFGVAVRSFAWPFGIYRPQHLALARQAGYRAAVTTGEGIDNPREWERMALRRIKISGKDNRLAFRMRMRTGRRGW